jgi:hypothetical protein
LYPCLLEVEMAAVKNGEEGRAAAERARGSGARRVRCSEETTGDRRIVEETKSDV